MAERLCWPDEHNNEVTKCGRNVKVDPKSLIPAVFDKTRQCDQPGCRSKWAAWNSGVDSKRGINDGPE